MSSLYSQIHQSTPDMITWLHPYKKTSHPLFLTATITVWPLPQCYIFFPFTSGQSHLNCPLGVVPDLCCSQAVFWSSGKVKMLAETAEWFDSVGGWVPGTEPVPGSALYITADTTFLCKQKSCLLSLTSFNVYSSDKSNSARMKWNMYFPACHHCF